MPELHHLGRVAYEAWRVIIVVWHQRTNTSTSADPPPWIEVTEEEKDAWQAAGVAAHNEGEKFETGLR